MSDNGHQDEAGHLPDPENDFCCLKCGRWRPLLNIGEEAETGSNRGVSLIADMGRAVAGYRDSYRTRYICNDCVSRRRRRTLIFIVILILAVIGIVTGMVFLYISG